MKLKNLIIICLAVIMGLMAISCDQDADVGESNPSNPAKSVVSIGFNINMKLPSFDSFKAAYPDVTSDWISDATMDIIDSIWIVYHDNTSDDGDAKCAVAEKVIQEDKLDGTGVIKAGIANKGLASKNGLSMNVIPVKYREGYDGKDGKIDSKKVYYLGNLRDNIIIDKKVSLGYKKLFDVTVDGIWTTLDLNIPEPAESN